ncbi:MAG: LytTR family transcriptional regulator [Deltaproteobacteria bacterium]|nr:LytTR family transcriptional regulator [Deltaproteobacteria bacterium]
MAPSALTAGRGLASIKQYLSIPLGARYRELTNRLQLYPMLALLFFLEGLLAWSLYQGPMFLLDHMALTTVFSLHKALIYALCLGLVDILALYLPNRWGAWDNRTVGKQWLIWGVGCLLGFCIYRFLGICLICFYAPELLSFFIAHPQAAPGTATLMLFAVPAWFCAVFLTLQMAQGKPIPIADAPEAGCGPRQPFPLQEPKAHSSDEAAVGSDPEGCLELAVDSRQVRLPHSRITHVSVEDHYCRVFYAKGEKLENVMVRLALKDIMQELPEASFQQIHRSHLANFRHASGIHKKGRAHKLVLSRFDLELPISRYRLDQIQPMLEAAKHPQTV